MNGTQESQWPQIEQLDPMASMQDMDFSNFLDIGDIDLTNFPSLQQGNITGELQGSQNSSGVTYNGEAQGYQQDPAANFGADCFNMPGSMDGDHIMQNGNVGGSETHDFADALNNGTWAQQQQQQLPQQIQGNVYQPPQHVPPTPNSYEMHGNAGRYLQQQMDAQTRAFLEQRYQLKRDDQMAFTPLVSPAVTPQDSQFQNMPEYTIPGAYFSPLTSPALMAQNGARQQQQQHQQLQHQQQHQHMQGYCTNPSTAGSSVATSPIDLNMDVDMLGDALSLPEPAKRQKPKPITPRSAGPAARVRQSPIVKPRKRKSTTLSTVMSPKEASNLLRDIQGSAPLSSGLMRPAHFIDSSGTDSISPEPLCESLMGPPPRPTSGLHSPSLKGQSHSAPASASINGSSGAPATPASLMSIERSKKSGSSTSLHSGPHSAHPLAQSHIEAHVFDDIALPPAAAGAAAGPQRPYLESIDTSTPTTSADATPRLVARKTPKIGPSTTPGLGGFSMSAASSPSISALTSPVTASTPMMFGQKQSGKSNKKRGSVSTSSTTLISPAIRPKISPSIKPLLPEGASLNESQQALLLASKSNYTHLLEGTLLPGVSYPESLSSGLTSKRTSHKIAEQGRRNRINEALKEMQSLLPKGATKRQGSMDGSSGKAEDDDDDKDSPKNTAEGKSANSKAATVESAIEYIKVLQKERMQAAEVLRQKDEEVAELRKQLSNAALRPKDEEDEGKEAERSSRIEVAT